MDGSMPSTPPWRPLRDRGLEALDALIRSKQNEKNAIDREIKVLNEARSLLAQK